MNDRPAPVEEDAQRWACAELGVAEDAPAEAIRAAFLKHVAEAEFFPTADSIVALQTLTGAAPDSASQVILASADAAPRPDVAVPASPRVARIASQRAQDRRRAPVEEFAEQFFSIDVSERVQKWFELRGRCQSSPALLARLEGLSAGLHIDRPAALADAGLGPSDSQTSGPQTPRERLIAEKVFELFTLRPVDRAERQQEILQAWHAELSEWRWAARSFKKQFPQIAALGAEFVDTVQDRPKPPRRGPIAPAASPVRQTGSGYASPSGTDSSGGNGVGRWTAAIVIFLCVSAFSRFMQDKLHHSPKHVRQKSPAELQMEQFHRDQAIAKMKADTERALQDKPKQFPANRRAKE